MTYFLFCSLFQAATYQAILKPLFWILTMSQELPCRGEVSETVKKMRYIITVIAQLIVVLNICMAD